MRFEWDEAKNVTNLAKHGVRFETAALVFDDPLRLSVLDRRAPEEERWLTLGSAGGVVVLLVAHTDREEPAEEVIRIISARRATATERKRYEEDHTGHDR